MLVVTRMADGEPHLVQPRRPGQQLRGLLALERPGALHLCAQKAGERLHPTGLDLVHMVLLAHAPDGEVADVVVPQPPHLLVEQPLAHRRLRVLQPLDAERFEERDEDGHAARKDRMSVALEPLHREPVGAAGRLERSPHLLQRGQRDAARGPTVGAHHLVDCPDAPRRANLAPPTLLEEPVTRRQHLSLCCQHGLVEPARAQFTIAEEAEREAHAAHRDALTQLRLKAAPHDAFGAAAADVDDQVAGAARRNRMGHAGVNEPRLLLPRDNLDAVAQPLLGLAQEGTGVARLPQRARPHRANPLGRHATKPLTEPLQRCKGPLLRGLVQHPLLGQTSRQLHPLLEPVHHLQLAAHLTGDDHVKAVGPQIHSRQQRGRSLHRRTHRSHTPDTTSRLSPQPPPTPCTAECRPHPG